MIDFDDLCLQNKGNRRQSGSNHLTLLAQEPHDSLSNRQIVVLLAAPTCPREMLLWPVLLLIQPSSRICLQFYCHYAAPSWGRRTGPAHSWLSDKRATRT